MDERSNVRLLHHGGRGVANPTSKRSLKRAGGADRLSCRSYPAFSRSQEPAP